MALLQIFITPWYSIENLALNYFFYLSIFSVGLFIYTFALYKLDLLGDVVGGFFSVDRALNQDREMVVELNGHDGGAKEKKNLGDDAAAVVEEEEKKEAENTDLDAAEEEKKEDDVPVIKQSNERKSGAVRKTPSPPRECQSLDAEDLVYLKQLLRQHVTNDTAAWHCLFVTLLYGFVAIYFMHLYPCWLSVLLFGTWHVRVFMIFHDACHRSFFRSIIANNRLAVLCEAVAGQNAVDWTLSHNHHHAHLGRADVMDFSLSVWFSEKEYASFPLGLKVGYRAFRDPFVLPFVISLFVFHLFPVIKKPVYTLSTRMCFYGPVYLLFGQQTFLLSYLAAIIGGIIGFLLFHIQHQCNTPYRVTKGKHSSWDAGMMGSTHLLVWWPFTIMTLGIEYHHIHHASTQVPCYNLAKCHLQGEKNYEHGQSLWDKAGVNRVGLYRAFLSLFHSLYKGDCKYTHDHINAKSPAFVSFDIYHSLGLEDTAT
mmetsp:Transcript_10603/g.13082  ORF Transcript_10603/g.13082 Transcript_10603/m.13082 type:complete len:482 (-) Transcript_10603:284-1729(-)|eukprot:CAMPEP_0172505186 /NCGR_PEP_ID=MMETSP1066-20121228/184240_1 /TAXON_ID=671091 /ORGANISM="Coscinodiscus wailesii, Strain CCMP2513" /LENGTH=481 /DNA_ID=CAMNT_0013281689 /DNA_START=179 /DNA_END=1624 /DNA_ORIENTATION=+